jgi:uncharacterized protein (DUF2147 family)
MMPMHSLIHRLRPVAAASAIWLAAMGAAWADNPATPMPSTPTGEWLVAKKLARIRIVDCNDQMWGVVSWEVQPGVDSKNPDAALRSRPTLGMPILLGMTQTKINQWDGQIYNSQDGHTYSANIKLETPDVLRVQGCFLAILCGGEDWTRVDPADATTAPTVPPVRKNRTATPVAQRPSDDEVCSTILGPAWLSHQRGLK